MTLIRTGLWNGVAVVVKMLTMLGINKVLAIFVGPAGYGALGQFQNAVQMMTTLTNGAINVGVTKYTAEFSDSESAQRTLWGTAGTLTLVSSVSTAFGIAIFHERLAEYFLHDRKYGGVFLWFAGTFVLFSFNTLLLAILNGKKEVPRYVLANIAGSTFSLLITVLLVMWSGLYGALIGLATYQSVSFFATFYLSRKVPWFSFRSLIGTIDRTVARNLLKYVAMATTSAVCVPMSQILVRNHLGATFGGHATGLWEATWRLSTAYLMFATTTLGVYYLPRFSELANWTVLRNEIVQGYKIIIPITMAASFVIYLMRDTVISLLFTTDFSSMRDLFAWQMFGDTLKIAGWMLSYVMLGKAMFKLFMLTEVIFSLSFVGWTYLFTAHFGLQGVAMAYATNYATYWLAMIVCIKYSLTRR